MAGFADEAKIYVFSRTAPTVASNSPFGVKIVAFARMAGIPHVVRPANPRKAPKGKATHGGNTVADSELIMNYLTNTYLSHEEGAAGGAGARPTSSYLAFPAMTPEQQARRCVQCGSVDDSNVCLRNCPGLLTPLPGCQCCAFGRVAALLNPRGVTVR